MDQQVEEQQELLNKELRPDLEGHLLLSSLERTVYSSDASIYERQPLAVVQPKSEQDLVATLAVASAHRLPVTARGAATGLSGGCLGSGLVIDMSRYLTEVKVEPSEPSLLRCQSGAVLDQCNRALVPYGRRLAVDLSTSNRATLGGMVANNASGIHSLLYGSMARQLRSVTLLLAGGQKVELKPLSIESWALKGRQINPSSLVDRLLASLWQMRQHHFALIEERWPPLERSASGYRLGSLLASDQFNPCELIAGSEGTLGLITQMELATIAPLPHVGLWLLFFKELAPLFELVPELLSFAPSALEMIDEKIASAGRLSPLLAKEMAWLPHVTKGLLIVELSDETALGLRYRMDQLAHWLAGRQEIERIERCQEPSQMAQIWQLRKSGLGLLMSKRSYSRAIAFLEDVTVPPEELASFMEQFLPLLEGRAAGLYGHVGAGCLHLRPYLDLREPSDRELLEPLMRATAELLVDKRGVLSGEHGDGWVRSWLNRTLFGEELYPLLVELKALFDPLGIMNPGKVVTESQQLPKGWRRPAVAPADAPFLDFGPEGGLALAVDLCNGNGACRKSRGVMCPSFQATRNEYDSTRARANALRSALQGESLATSFGDPELAAILDLCLSCKGCKRECPSQVDMARLKAEVSYHQRRFSLRDWLFAHVGRLLAIARPCARWLSPLMESPMGRWMGSCLGITSQRPWPLPAARTFTQQLRHERRAEEGTKLLLLADTFTQFLSPQVGLAAHRLLSSLGYSPMTPSWLCCGRTHFSKGFLPQAKAHAKRLLAQLRPYVQQKIPILVVEPSCLSMLCDDYKALVPEEASLLSQLEPLCRSVEEFLLTVDLPPLLVGTRPTLPKLFFHSHCHERALQGNSLATVRLFRRIDGLELIESQAGCCGMAGSFGYEADHYGFSQKIAELSLFRQIEQLDGDTLLCSSGSSCRTQIAERFGRRCYHPVELLEELFLASS